MDIFRNLCLTLSYATMSLSKSMLVKKNQRKTKVSVRPFALNLASQKSQLSKAVLGGQFYCLEKRGLTFVSFN